MSSLLFELGVEDIPSIYLNAEVAKAFGVRFEELLRANKLWQESTRVTVFVTNRRLACMGEGLLSVSPDSREQISGPAKEAAFDKEGHPTKALEGFLHAKGGKISQLKEMQKGNRTFVALEKKIKGKPAKEVLPGILSELIAKTVFPKTMRWDGAQTGFVRPIRWILALLDDKKIACTYAGIKAGDYTYGHRFYTNNQKIRILSLGEYESILEKNYVIVDQAKRAARIKDAILQVSHNHVHIKEQLFESLVYLTEWPTALLGMFDAHYLDLPKEVLQESLSKNQKIFSVVNEQGELLPQFVGVVNSGAKQVGTPDEKVQDEVIKNYEQILYARLSDARFFWHEDIKIPFSQKTDRLSSIMFLKGLGTVTDRLGRMRAGAVYLKNLQGLINEKEGELLWEAISLCKTDLVTHMVYEFPSLQGVMGKYYALAEGKDPQVASAIEEHYQPKGAGDALPASKLGSVLAILDKIDIIVGCFALGLLPTGNEDPYGLRRAVRGVMQIILEKRLSFDIYGLYDRMDQDLGAKKKGSHTQFASFLKERMRLFFVQEKGYRYDLVDAVLAIDTGNIFQQAQRLEALSDLAVNARDQLLRACKIVERTTNILKGADMAGVPNRPEDAYLKDPLDRQLWERMRSAQAIEDFLKKGLYKEATCQYADIFYDILHEFFDKVLVNAEDQNVRKNRLSIMRLIKNLYTERGADLSKIVTQDYAVEYILNFLLP